jgi:WD40 repeat protein
MKTGKEKGRITHDTRVFYSLCFSSDGKTLAGVGWSQSVQFWDLATLRKSNSWEAHGSDIYHVSMLPEKRLLTTSSDGWARVWDLCNGEKLHEVSQPKGNHAATVSTDGSVLITGDARGFVRSWDIPYRRKK